MAAVTINVSSVKPLGDRIFLKVSASEEKTVAAFSCPTQQRRNLKLEKLLQ